MSRTNTLSKAGIELQNAWLWFSARATRGPAVADDMARGEFISPFISESGLNFPRGGDRSDTRR